MLEQDAIASEQIKAYFKDANDLNLAGAAVFSLMIFLVHRETPLWTWAIPLFGLYVLTAYKSLLIRQYKRNPQQRTAVQWIGTQAVTGAVAGICWGAASVAMLAHLPVIYQLVVLTISTVVAATATSEGFAVTQPPRNFIIASITPPMVGLFTFGDQLHTVLAVTLCVFMPVTVSLVNKKNRIFIEAQHLRFQNERLAKELKAQHSLVEQASHAKSRFLVAASHDLRQPLAALVLFLGQLEREPLASSGKFLVNRSQEATLSLHSLLESLLDISKLDGHAVKPQTGAIAVQTLFYGMENEFYALASEKGLSLKFIPCSSIVESDRMLLSQLLRNLISNAICYTRSGRVVVGCRHRHGRLDIEVHDTGIGIAEDQLPRIFDEFYQVENRERDRRQGLGLGLSIVDRAVKLLGHSLTVRSVLGKGTSFVLTLPLARSDSAEDFEAADRAPEEFDLSGKRIILIENEGPIREAMEALLRDYSCKVWVAPSSSEILHLDSKGIDRIDLIISDYGLSGSESGIDAINKIRAHWGKIPALLYTGDISKETAAAARTAGLSILYKPANPKAVLNAVASAMVSSN